MTVHTPGAASLSAGLVCFDVEGRDPADVVAGLAQRRVVASVTPYARRHVRLGPGIVNTAGDVDVALRAIADL